MPVKEERRKAIHNALIAIGRIEVKKSGESNFIIPTDEMAQIFRELEGE